MHSIMRPFSLYDYTKRPLLVSYYTSFPSNEASYTALVYSMCLNYIRVGYPFKHLPLHEKRCISDAGAGTCTF